MIPFLDLKAQYRNLQAEILPAIAAVLESSQFVLGKEVARFEEEFAEYCGVRHCVAVNSGTSALHLALLAAGVKPGDEVITTSFTFVATVAAILYAGAKPVLVDIHPESYTIDPELLPAAVTPRTRAILPVHLYGQPADMDPIMAIARTHGLVVIEDACQAHGATYKNRKVGGIGELGCFSFYPGKNLGAYGEGGAVTTNTAAFDETLRMMRDWGQREKYLHELQGFNYRMDGIQGAVLRVKLRRLNEWTEQRQSHASLYDRLLRDSGVLTPSVQPYTTRHVYHIYGVLVANRPAVQQFLLGHGIHTGIHYPYPIHLVPAYAQLGYRPGDFPMSEKVAQRELSLPMFAELEDNAIRTVADHLREAVTGSSNREE
jgi:dTDP-4-amino-4,6-dideoxygalactose transaminase